MNPSATTVPTEEQGRPEPPFDATLVEEMLRQLDKTVRAHQLYMHNNPTYLKSLELLRATFPPIWAHTDSLVLQVTDTLFTWSGVAVHEQAEKASDSLPWTLYKDGVREISLSPGFEGEELDALLDIVPRVRKAQAHEDDLLTILWEQEFSHLTYRYVEVSSEPGLPIDPAAQAGRWPVTPGRVVDDPKLAVEEAKREQQEAKDGKPGGGEEELKRSPGIVRMEDFDSTLYFLDADEIAYLRRETEREYATNLRHTVLNALIDILEVQPDPAVRKEVAEDIDSLTLHLLAGRQFAAVAALLREIASVIERVPELPADVRSKLALLPDRLSEPATLAQLLEAMDEATSLPPQSDLADLFGQLRPAALMTIFAWLGQTQNAKLRPLLEGAADRLAQSNTAEVVRLISSDEGFVAMEAVKRAGALKTAAAVPALAKVLGDRDRDLRVAAVAALAEIGTPGAMQSLEKALDDSDRDVRVATIKALAQRTYKPALSRVSLLVKSREIRDADRTERLAVFELFGLLCGDAGVPFLDDMLNGKGGLFGRKEDPELRACAAWALGKVASPKAQESLARAIGEKDVIVRSAVARAQKGGGAA